MQRKKKAKFYHKQQTSNSLFPKSQESDPPTHSDLLTDKNAKNNEKSSASSSSVDTALSDSESR